MSFIISLFHRDGHGKWIYDTIIMHNWTPTIPLIDLWDRSLLQADLVYLFSKSKNFLIPHMCCFDYRTDKRLATHKSMPIFHSFASSNLSKDDPHKLKTSKGEQLNKSSNALTLSAYMLERIWKPPTYFLNSHSSILHTITSPNKFVRLSNVGVVLYSSRWVLYF